MKKNETNEAIAKELNEKGYKYVTFGWDFVKNSLYYKYRNETQSFADEGYLMLPRIIKEDDLPDFYYTKSVEASDVATLIECGEIEGLLSL